MTTVKASPTISTTRQRDGRRRGGHVAMLSDSATLSGGFNPTGTITFTLTRPTAPPWTYGDGHGQRQRHLHTRQLRCRPRRSGTYHLGTPATAATANNNAVSRQHGTNEPVTTVKASPTISTTGQRDGRRRGRHVAVLSDSATADRRLQPDRHDHLHAVRAGRHHQPGGITGRSGQR